jgi:hypothetical protein
MVSSITPTTLTYKAAGVNEVIVTGIGIGSKDGVDFDTSVVARFPDRNADIKLSVTNTADGISFVFPRDLVDPLFSKAGVSKVAVTLKSTVPVGCGPFGLFSCNKEFSFPYTALIFPKVAVVADIEQSKTEKKTDPSSHKLLKIEHAHAPEYDSNGGPWAADDALVYPENGYAITEISPAECKKNNPSGDDGICQYVYPDPEIWNQLKTNNGAYARIYGRNNSKSVNLYFNVYEEKLVDKPDKYPAISYTFGVNDSKEIVVKSDATYVAITAKPVIGNPQVFTLVPAGGSATSLITCTGGTPVGDNQSKYQCVSKGYDAF